MASTFGRICPSRLSACKVPCFGGPGLVDPQCHGAGTHAGRLLPRDEPSIWYEAAATIPSPTPAPADTTGATEAQQAQLQAYADAALQAEAAAFERDLGGDHSANMRSVHSVKNAVAPST